MIVELRPFEDLHHLRHGNLPPPDRQFPSREAADAYHVVYNWLRLKHPRGISVADARDLFRTTWRHLPWERMAYWAMVKTAAKCIKENG